MHGHRSIAHHHDWLFGHIDNIRLHSLGLHKFTARIASYATLARSDNARNTSRTYSNCSRNVISDVMIIAFLCTLLLFLLLN